MNATTYETVKVQKEDGITWVILSRPAKRNAMSPQLHYEMDSVLEQLAVDPETKVLVVTGEGDAFSAGMDLQRFFRDTDNDPVAGRRSFEAAHRWQWQRLSTFPTATIAMVNGYCIGGAFGQLCACDFAIAAEDAVFSLSEINWGIVPGGEISWVIGELLSYRDALYYAVTGDPFDGKRAAEIRLVNYAVPRARLRDETIALARKLMSNNPTVLRYTKEAVRSVRGMSVGQALDYLKAKNEALRFVDQERGRQQGLHQFLDEKRYRPTYEPYERRPLDSKDKP